MTNNIIKGLAIILVSFLFLECKNESPEVSASKPYRKIAGKTMGTTYHVAYQDLNDISLKPAIDSILESINLSLSTYIPESTISRINNDDNGDLINILKDGRDHTYLKYTIERDSHFIKNFEIAREIFLLTEGYFDPTVGPLVNYWGFGYTPKKAITNIDSNKVSKILQSVGLEKWSISHKANDMVILKPLKSELDFSALAKGYGVDILAEFLKTQSVKNFMVEIGGEVTTSGINEKGKKWTVGLSRPEIDAPINDFVASASISDYSIASSGNYRNYYKVGKKYYGHELNPITGYPEQNEVLGTSVIAPQCIYADAYATAFMVMGLERSKRIIEKLNDMESALFISNSEGEIEKITSTGFIKMTSQEEK